MRHEFLLSLIGSVLGSGIVVGIVQLFLNHSLSKKLEKLKTSLSGELFERQTKFAWLHTERSKTLVKLYALLARLDTAFTLMLTPVQAGDSEAHRAKIKQAADAATQFFGFWTENAVLFDTDLNDNLFKLNDEYRRVWAMFVPNHELLPKGKEWAEAWKQLGRDVEPIQKQVRDKVRSMLTADV